MPIRQELDPAARVFRTAISGVVTPEDMRRHFAIVRQVRAAQYPELIEVCPTSQAFWGMRDLIRLAHVAKELLSCSGPMARAIVVTNEDHAARARTFASLVAGWIRVGVFYDRESAEEWLTRQVARQES